MFLLSIYNVQKEEKGPTPRRSLQVDHKKERCRGGTAAGEGKWERDISRCALESLRGEVCRHLLDGVGDLLRGSLSGSDNDCLLGKSGGGGVLALLAADHGAKLGVQLHELDAINVEA